MGPSATSNYAPLRQGISALRRPTLASAPRPSPQVQTFTLRAEETENLGGISPSAPEPVRNAGVKLGRFARGENEVVIADHEP